MRGEGHLGLAAEFAQLKLGVDERLDFLAAPVQSLDDYILGQEAGIALHHGQGVARGREKDVQIALGLLLKGGIEHKLAVDPADAPARHRALKGQGRNHQGRRRAGQGQHVGLVLLVGGNHAGQHLDVLVQAFGKERADGPVDEAGNQGFTLRGTADLAPEEAAGNASCGVHFFGIFHRKREKALVEFQGLGADRDQHHRAAALHPDRAVGLIGQTAAFKNDFLAAHLGCDPGGIENILQHM